MNAPAPAAAQLGLAAPLTGTHARRVFVASGAAIALVVVASANGGYFPTSWNWATIAFGWLAIVLLILRRHLAWSPVELSFFGLLSAYAVWIWLSAIWSIDRPETILEGERVLLYVLATVVVLLAVEPDTISALLGGCLAGMTLTCVYGLVTRLLPDRLGGFDSVTRYRLASPIGYWNAEGLYAALGALIALGLALGARRLWARALAGASLLVLLPTLQFTFSRGSLIAFALGVATVGAVARPRVRLLAGLAALTPPLAVAVTLGYGSHALTTRGSTLHQASSQGHRLALVLAALAIIEALIAAVICGRLSRWQTSPRLERVAALGLAGLVTAGAIGVVVVLGSPDRLGHHAWESFIAGRIHSGPDLDDRLFRLSNHGRVALWRSALRELDSGPILGRGAGTFESWWDEHRATADQVRNAHSLYIETLGGLGLVGFCLIVATFALALLGGWRARHERYGPFLVAALLAYVFATGIDWDWQIPAVTLVGLFAGAALLRLPPRPVVRPLSPPLRILAAAACAAIVAFAVAALVGNVTLDQAQSALAVGHLAQAEHDARRSSEFAPWDAAPVVLLAGIEAATFEHADAQRTYEHALALEPRNSLAWYGLALISAGPLRRHAASEVITLNPLSAEADELRSVAGTR